MTVLLLLIDAANHLRRHPWRAAALSVVLAPIAVVGSLLVGFEDGPLVALTTFAVGFPWALRAGAIRDAACREGSEGLGRP
jgi:hypothetical protein